MPSKVIKGRKRKHEKEARLVKWSSWGFNWNVWNIEILFYVQQPLNFNKSEHRKSLLKIKGQSSDVSINHEENNMRHSDKSKNILWVKAVIKSIEADKNWQWIPSIPCKL